MNKRKKSLLISVILLLLINTIWPSSLVSAENVADHQSQVEMNNESDGSTEHSESNENSDSAKDNQNNETEDAQGNENNEAAENIEENNDSAEALPEEEEQSQQQLSNEDDPIPNALPITTEYFKVDPNGIVITNESGVSITEIPVEQGARVQIDMKWHLEGGHPYQAGSTFSFQLPQQFELAAPIPSGGQDEPDLAGGVGTFRISADGLVTFTFNEEINEGAAVNNGTFHVWREFKRSNSSESTKQELKFLVEEETLYTIPVHFKVNGAPMTKIATSNKTMNPTEMSWVIDFNKAEQTITNAILHDELPHELTVENLKIYKLNVSLNGNVTEGEEVTASYTPSSTTGNFEISFGNISDAYRVKYTTPITDTSISSYTNKGTVTGTSEGSELMKAQATVQVKFSEPLEKLADGYDAKTQSMGWKVKYNFNERFFSQGDAGIEDHFDTENYELLENSFVVNKVSIASNGAGTNPQPMVKGEDYQVVKTATGFKLNFTKDITEAYEIKYKTKSIPRVYDEAVTVKNEVTMHGGLKEQASHTLRQVIFNKTSGNVNYNSKKITWNMSLNQDEKVMDNVVITDHFDLDQHMIFLPDTLVISGLTEDEDYTVSKHSGLDYNQGFIITFNQPVTASHTIMYQTAFDPKLNTKGYTNTAKLDWEENSKAQVPIEKEAKINPDNYTQNNGNKTGVYDRASKEITWTIDINYNLHPIEQAVVRDQFTGEQTLDKNRLTVHELKLSGGVNGVEESDLLQEGIDYTVIETKQGDQINGFELKFVSPINKAYRITYKTSLVNHPVVEQYSNQATLRDGDNPIDLSKLSSTVAPPHGGEYIMKTGLQGSGENQDFAYWTVHVNRSQSHIEAGAKLTDALSSNQILVKDSFKVYKTNINGDLTKAGELDPEQYNLEVENNQFTISFTNAIDRALIVEYQSFINADHGENITNEAKFAGQSSGVVDKSQDKSIKVIFSGASGGGTTSKGDLTIVKVDSASADVKLKGAIFGLYDKTGKTLIQSAETDEAGLAVFSNIKHKEYMLKELSAPEGYLFDLEYKTGKVISFSSSNHTIEVKNVKGVWDVQLTKVDKDKTDKMLEGAHYKLQLRNAQGEYEDVADYKDMVTLHDGTISYSNLQKGGNYRLIETIAPHGYKLDVTPILFTVDENQSATKQIQAVNEINIGAVALVKRDALTKAPLADVTFKLQTESGELIQDNLITDTEGQITVADLPAGQYQFVEVSSHPDYVLDPTPRHFEIVEEGVTVNVEVTNDQIPGTVILSKIELNRPERKLANAIFRILDENKAVLKDNSGKPVDQITTDSTGQALFKLRPGKYYLQEIKAPVGYVLQSALTPIEVVKEKETKITIANERYVGGGGTPSGPDGGSTPPVPNVPQKPDPEKPNQPDHEQPEQPKPNEPNTPDKENNNPPKKEEVKTPKKTPVSGKVKVPEDTTPKVSEKPKNGKVSIDKNGNWTYTPNKKFEGKDSFTISIKNEEGQEEFITIDVDVIPLGGVTGNGSGSNPSSTGTLPQTGENSSLPIQLLGGAMILSGIALYVRKRKQTMK